MEYLYKQYRVCGEHFEENQFMNPVVRNRLKPTAVPTIIAVTNPPPLLTPKRKIPKRTSLPRQPTSTQEVIPQIPEPTSSQYKSQ